jgi:hypothetical protein
VILTKDVDRVLLLVQSEPSKGSLYFWFEALTAETMRSMGLLACNTVWFRKSPQMPPLDAGFLFSLFFDPEGGVDMCLRNVGVSSKYIRLFTTRKYMLCLKKFSMLLKFEEIQTKLLSETLAMNRLLRSVMLRF